MNPRHGTAHSYDCGCRCERCVTAKKYARNDYHDPAKHAAKAKAYRERLKAAPMPETKHGTLGGYNNHGCRCPKCREAVARYRRGRYTPVFEAADQQQKEETENA